MKTILFQGDSITDAGRSRSDLNDLGPGYPALVAQQLHEVECINRGISGNRAKDLVARWQTDTLDLHPDVVSILIGINDVWRRYDSKDPTSDADFEKSLRTLLEPLAKNQTKVLLIMPFLLDINESVTRMRDDLHGKQAVIRKLAKEYQTLLFEADDFFAGEIAKGATPASFSGDGVHPTPLGHQALANALLPLF